MALSPAERLLQCLGITESNDIDLEAIAFHVGAELRFRRLDGCDARIIGVEDRAIITVNQTSTDRRRRYSIAHELGHWHHHRGKCLVCRVEAAQSKSASQTERVADRYAADLLMPWYLFRPAVRAMPKLNFATVSALATNFETSITATAIRMVESDQWPSLLVCHEPNGRRWFTRSASVPDRWFPRDALDSESYAFDILFGTAQDDSQPRKIGADAWFDRREAERYELNEQSMRTRKNEILTLLTLTDSAMLD